MAHQHDFLAATLNAFPLEELSSDEQKGAFQGIKERLLNTSDVQEELKTLYKVNGFADFAAGLLWVVDRAEKAPGSGISMEDETLLLASFRRAMGEQVAAPEPAVASGGGEIEKIFAATLDRFSEAVQGGTAERDAILADLVGLAEGADVQALGGETAQFGLVLAEFLRYITQNQLFDDIRVINIFANVSSSISLWANTPPEGQASLLEEAFSLVRDFKNQFE